MRLFVQLGPHFDLMVADVLAALADDAPGNLADRLPALGR